MQDIEHEEVYYPKIIVLMTMNNGQNRLEQINLTDNEQKAVMGFIREMKEYEGKELEVISGATRFVRATVVRNTSYEDAERVLQQTERYAERVSQE